MAAYPHTSHHSVFWQIWRLFFGEYSLPSYTKEGVRCWRHSRYYFGWGNPDEEWRVLFYLPF